MAIKLVAVDMDDTLLNKSLQVSPRTAEAVRQAVAQGVTVTIATGRMYASALPYAHQLGLDVPIITYNGGLIKCSMSGDVLFHRPIDEPMAHEVLALFKEHGWYIQSYIDDTLYVAERNENALYYEKMAGVSAFALGEDFYTMPGAPTKMLAVALQGEMDAIEAAVRQNFEGRLFIAKSKANYLEIANPQVNKGVALAYLADKLGISRNEVMAVGDSQNDLDMITYAGWGVAMGNASDKVKAAAQAVTEHNDADGVAEAIAKYVLCS